MPEESTTPNLVELVNRVREAANRRDFDAVESFYAPGAVLRGAEAGTFEGAAAIRGFAEDMASPYEELHVEAEEIIDLGNGVTFGVIGVRGRPVGQRGDPIPVGERRDLDQRRDRAGDAQHEHRRGPCCRRTPRCRTGVAMSENLDLVRSINAEWERGDYSSVEWADPEIEFVIADGPEPGSWTEMAGMVEGMRTVLNVWEDFQGQGEQYRELDGEHILVFVHNSGRGKTSGMEIGQMPTKAANLFHLRDGKVIRLVIYWDRERALADLGLAE
jgi:ketosteroid isomerase-like protein